MELKPLTKKQARVLEFMIAEVESGRGLPTIREIGEKFGMRSTGSVRDVFKALRKKGYVIHIENKARSNILNPKVFKVSVSGKEKITLREPFKRKRKSRKAR